MLHAADYEKLEPLLGPDAVLRHRPVAASWPRPGWAHVSQDGRMLLWSPFRPSSRKEPAPATARRGLLEEFISLDGAPAADFAAYARKWGVLAVCRDHARPACPCGSAIVTADLDRVAALLPPPGVRLPDAGVGIVAEPVAVWREYARIARCLVRVGAAIIASKRPADADIGVLADPPRYAYVRAHPRSLLVEWINAWLTAAQVRPAVSWAGLRPSISLNARGLFGALALQLIVACGDFSGMGVCHHCAREYPCVRAPKRGQRSFCPACRKVGEPARYALADYRARKKDAHP